MKNDLVTAIAVAILGFAIAFVACNFITGDIAPVSVKTISGSFSAEVGDPSVEVFNYRAINPTVEVYVGENGNNCDQFDSGGNCISNNNQNTSGSQSGQGD